MVTNVSRFWNSSFSLIKVMNVFKMNKERPAQRLELDSTTGSVNILGWILCSEGVCFS